MQYRVAIRRDTSMPWQWKSTVLSSLNALLQWLQFYRVFPRDCLRVFSFNSREEMNEQLMRENKGLTSTSVTAAQFLQERRLSVPEVNRGTPGDGTQAQKALPTVAVSTKVHWNQGCRTVPDLSEKSMSLLEKRRLELEDGTGGDHDVAYSFVEASSPQQVLTWMRLLSRIHRGEIQP